MLKGLVAAIAALALLASCTSRTSYGECIGAFDDPDPTLRYSTDAWNIFMGVVFFEMVIPPIVVVASEIRCPVGRKEAQSAPPKAAP